MTSTYVSVPRRIGRIATGLAGLALLVGLLGGAPIALYLVAGNPLPDHLPTFGEAVSTLTSPDDGQLFLRALALVGWLGWLTFALSVLIELVALVLRVPAPHLPGMRTQQRMATALIASVTLIVSTGAAASASALGLGQTTGYAMTPAGAPSIGIPGDTPLHVGYQSQAPTYTAGFGAAPARPAPALVDASQNNTWDQGPWSGTPGSDPTHAATGGGGGQAAVPGPVTEARAGEPVYRVEQDDYLGSIADRYLGDFERYPELAELNNIGDPDLIKAGDFLKMPESAEDRGVREHATGLVDAPPPAAATPPSHPGEVEPAPSNTPAPSNSAPSTPTPSTSAPGSTAPGSTAPGAPAPGASAPGSSAPGSAAPGSAAPGAATPAPAPSSSSGAAAPGAHGTQPPAPHHGEDPLGGLNGAKGLDGNDRGPLPLAVSAVLAAAAVVGAQVGALFGLRDRRRRPSRH
ncbi:LysM peptidoglycan-binding domain-containing protein [Catenuloplanes japonicus]|uniref:LysM peptidoglycan-binding domain-containing protein n=1 Tax=Catenuloplanes japonicus TaxID=33876 RepID=UPI00068E788B|nr:LysM domain-containing protein [Catenuloplanes japonicus]